MSRPGRSPAWLVDAWRRCRDHHARNCARFVECGWVLTAAEEARKFKAADARVLAAMGVTVRGLGE